MSSDPRRLFESSDVPEALRVDLQRARASDPAEFDVAAGLAAFEATIAEVPEGADAGAAEAATGVSKSVTWIVVAIVAAATAGAIAWAVSRDREAPKPKTVVGEVASAPETTAPEPARTTEPEPDPTPAAASGSEPASFDGSDRAAPTESEASAPRPKPKPKARTRSQRPEPTPDRLAAEMKATNAAKQLLESDPARALTLARQADRDFPTGLFQQERRAIVTLALFDLGRAAEAKPKAKAYLARHPRGSFADRIREALRASEG